MYLRFSPLPPPLPTHTHTHTHTHTYIYIYIYIYIYQRISTSKKVNISLITMRRAEHWCSETFNQWHEETLGVHEYVMWTRLVIKCLSNCWLWSTCERSHCVVIEETPPIINRWSCMQWDIIPSKWKEKNSIFSKHSC